MPATWLSVTLKSQVLLMFSISLVSNCHTHMWQQEAFLPLVFVRKVEDRQKGWVVQSMRPCLLPGENSARGEKQQWALSQVSSIQYVWPAIRSEEYVLAGKKKFSENKWGLLLLPLILFFGSDGMELILLLWTALILLKSSTSQQADQFSRAVVSEQK